MNFDFRPRVDGAGGIDRNLQDPISHMAAASWFCPQGYEAFRFHLHDASSKDKSTDTKANWRQLGAGAVKNGGEAG